MKTLSIRSRVVQFIGMKLTNLTTWVFHFDQPVESPNALAQTFLDEDRFSQWLNGPMVQGRVTLEAPPRWMLNEIHSIARSGNPNKLSVLLVSPNEDDLENSLLVVTVADYYRVAAAHMMNNGSLPTINELYI